MKIVFQLHSSPISPYPDLMMYVSTQTRPRLILIQVSRFASHLNPGSISTLSSYGDVRLTSIQFPSHLHPSPKIHASPTSRSCLTHAPIFASHIHLSDVSSPSRSWKFHLSSIQIQSQTHPGLEMCISIPSRSCTTCITSLLHTDHVSPQHMSWYLHPASIQVQKITSQLHPSPISPYSGLMMCTSTQSRSHLSPTQMSIFVFHLYPGNIKPWSMLQDLLSPPPPPPPPIYIQVTSHINPGPNICISHPSRWCLSLMCVTHPSRSCLTCIQIPISLSHLHPCTVSLPSRSEVSCLICIHVTSHLQPTHFHSSHDICITAPSMSYLTPIHVSILAPELHPDHVSPPFRSHD